MKRKLWKKILIGCLAAILLAGSAFAVTDTVKTLEAHYSGISVVVDGKAVTPKDATGAVVEPFIVDGTTYLPVRAVAEALGQDVAWDGDTRTVYIGEVPGAEVNWMQKLPPYMTEYATVYDGSDHTKSFSVAGTTQTLGIEFVLKQNHAGDSYAIWNTNGLYKSMTFTIGATNKRNATMEVSLNGEYAVSYELKYDDPPQTITIPLNYASNVKIDIITEYSSSYLGYAMYDISFAE